MDAGEQRPRRSTLTEGAPPRRSNSRVFLGLDALRSATALPNPRRRSSGGNSVQGVGNASVLGRKDNARPPSRTVPHPIPSPIPPQFRTLDSYNARNVAAALDQSGGQVDDAWQQVCVRVLPLFNGEGIRGFVEDLNILVNSHVERLFAQSQSTRQRATANPSVNAASLVTGLLIADLTDLIRTGLTNLAQKLAPTTAAQPLDDARLLARLNEVWLFFFTGILPHLEAVFWGLRADDRLVAATERLPRPGASPEESRIDVRRIALIEFRDEILHPEVDRLVPLLSHMRSGDQLGEFEPASRANSRRPSMSSSYGPPQPGPDIRRARSHPHPPSRPISPVPGAASTSAHPHPQRQHSSPPGLSPDPGYAASFPGPSSSSGAPSPHYPSAPTTPRLPVTTTLQAQARRKQMIAVLVALRTDDDRQREMDALLSVIRPIPVRPTRDRPSRANSKASSVRGNSVPPHDRSGSEDKTPGEEPISAPRSDVVDRFDFDHNYDERDEPGSGTATGLTGSPVEFTEDPSSLSSHGEGADVIAAFAAPSPLPGAIDARQRHRSRTMDSLDEEDTAQAVTQRRTHLPPSPVRPPGRNSSEGVFVRSEPGASAAALPKKPSLSLLQTGSVTGTEIPAAAAAAAAAGGGGPAATVKKARSRSFFMPGFKRSNSNASTSTNASGATTDSQQGIVQGLGLVGAGGGSDEDTLPFTASGGGGGGPGGGGADKLRRGLLRRNSSRRVAVEMVGAGTGVPALGAAEGFAVEDDE